MAIVDIIASGYEWICPDCETLNTEIEWTDEVTCGAHHESGVAEHATG